MLAPAQQPRVTGSNANSDNTSNPAPSVVPPDGTGRSGDTDNSSRLGMKNVLFHSVSSLEEPMVKMKDTIKPVRQFMHQAMGTVWKYIGWWWLMPVFAFLLMLVLRVCSYI